MVRRVFPLAVVIVATAVAACRAEPSGPAASRVLLRDTEEPECVDTVYEQRATRVALAGTATDSANAASTTASEGCHIVVIYY